MPESVLTEPSVLSFSQLYVKLASTLIFSFTLGFPLGRDVYCFARLYETSMISLTFHGTPRKMIIFLFFQMCDMTSPNRVGQPTFSKASFWLFCKVDINHSCKFSEKNQACFSVGTICNHTSFAALQSPMAWMASFGTAPQIVRNRCLKANQINILTPRSEGFCWSSHPSNFIQSHKRVWERNISDMIYNLIRQQNPE